MKHSHSLTVVSFLYVFLGIVILIGSLTDLKHGLMLAFAFSLFLSFAHFFISWGIWHKKKWSPFLGMAFELYIIFNFFMFELPLIREHASFGAPIGYGTLIFISILPIMLVVTFIMSILIIKRDHFIH